MDVSRRTKKKVVIIGAGPCGLVALKEMREAGHEAIVLEKGPGIGGVFSRTHDTQYDNLYLTISNMLMAFSDFPPEDLRIKYSSKDEYGAYLEAYARHFGLLAHIELHSEVQHATLVGDRWRITFAREGHPPEVIEADALLVATGSNHHARRVDLPGFTGAIVHSSEFKRAGDFAGKRVLVIGAGESAFDIACDVAAHAARTTVWARSPITPGPRFVNLIWADPQHDELEVMKDEAKWGELKISEFLESMTTSRMANAAPLWAYSSIRHLIWVALRGAAPAGRMVSAWNRQAAADSALLCDQLTVPTKSARLCTEAARGRIEAIVARRASFAGKSATFHELMYLGNQPALDGFPAETRVDDVDVAILCTGYQHDFSWLDAPGLDWSPRSWFKHCFPPGYGDKLMFLGFARPHQGGIPACAEMLSRYIALLLAGARALPVDYAVRATNEGAVEHEYYRNAQHSLNLVDYPAFMDSVARLIGCLPEAPELRSPQRLAQYWIYPNWPVWYRMSGPGARPEVIDKVLRAFPLLTSYRPNPFNLMALAVSLAQAPIDAARKPRSGLVGAWAFKAKRYLLHDNAS